MQIVPRKKQQSNRAMSLRDAMNQMFDESFWDPWKFWDNALPENQSGSSQIFIPNIDISEDSNNITIVADVPGYDTGNIEVTLNNNVLTFQGDMQEEKEEQDKKAQWYCKQCSSGSFYQKFTLPSHADAANIKCKSKNGKLTVIIPKRAEEKKLEGKKLPIETE